MVRLAVQAMATRFELVLAGDDPVRLRAAGEEALAEIRRLERQLSFYDPRSEISRVNALAGRQAVRLEPRLYRLLERVRRLWEATGGAFDPTVAPLMRCWGFATGEGRRPAPAALEEARRCTGLHRVVLEDGAVAFGRPGMALDLGGIGKGYAVDEAVTLLKEAGVPAAFLHGGTSTVYAYGAPDGGGAWKVAVPAPEGGTGLPEVLAVVSLDDEALSVSAPSGRAFEVDGQVYGHVLDPRTGCPVTGALLAAVVMPSATDADAFSTALLVQGAAGLDAAGAPPRALVVAAGTPGGVPRVSGTLNP
ncbi:MAG: FAD:protein FMN transferase [Rhodothermaceae bacterium]|nr:MAG: FAD:protein FMN transferase [Rhodothermaceae bacterium]